MKQIFTFMLLIGSVAGDAQYFQRYFNLDFTTPAYRHEVFNSGLKSSVNYASGKPVNYFFMSVGTSYLNGQLNSPNNKAHRLRVARTTRDGANVSNNLGYEFYRRNDESGASLNSTGNSIAEIDNGQGTGGYIAVGAVGSNLRTKAVAPGGSDASYAIFDGAANLIKAFSIDFGGNGDTAWCIRRSIFYPRTFLVCGHSYIAATGSTMAFVARLDLNGNLLWGYTYAFDATIENGLSSNSRARQLCENPKTGDIYVVGTHMDFASSSNINGLAFSLTSNGAVLWSSVYDIAKKDEFQAVRYSSDDYLLVGGSSNYKDASGANMTNMLLTKLRAGDGAIIWKTLLRAGTNEGKYDSKCFDLVEGYSTEQKPAIFLVGPAYTSAGARQLMYKTDNLGVGINNYIYNSMKIDSLFGIDYDNYNTATLGLAVFSSIRDEKTNYSHGHILKTTYDGRTCKDYCLAGPPINIAIKMNKIKIGYQVNQQVRQQELGWKIFKYATVLQCNQKEIACPTAAARPFVEQPVNGEQMRIYPNPVKNILYINVGKQPVSLSGITVYDMLGQPVLCKISSATAGIMQVDVGHLSKGSYLLMVKQNGSAKPISFIKE